MKLPRVIAQSVPLFIIVPILFWGLSNVPAKPLPALAYETTCPEYMTDTQCLEFLQQQAGKIQADKDALESSISAENFEQMSLYEQISYLSSEIGRIEIEIAEKEIDIERNNIEIRILGKDILEIQNNIDTLTQEINILDDTMRKRTKTSYKLSLMSPLEIILDSTNLETLMRKMKYIVEIKKKDRQIMADMEISQNHLEEEEEILAEKRADIQTKRNEIESQRAELAEDNKNLESQKSQQQVLLAESQAREQQYQNNLAYLQEQENAITQQITALIMSMYNSGQLPANTPVNAGDIIGYQGHTGYAYGSHLHFGLNYGLTNPFANGYLVLSGSYVTSGSARTPIEGGVLTQGFHGTVGGGGYSIDISGTIGSDYYWAPVNSVCCTGALSGVCIPSVQYASTYCGSSEGCWFSLRGEGSPIHAIKGGKVTNVTTDICGGKFTIVDHGNGETSLYLHLR